MDDRMQDISDKAADLVSRMTGKNVRLTYRELAPAGLDREALLELAYQAAGDKVQWYNGETLVLSEDACLSSSGEAIWIYQVDGTGTSRRVAKAFILDPLQGWVRAPQPLTAKQAMAELFDL